jgi:hypothetical protein
LFLKTEEELREYDRKIAKEAEEQKRKARDSAGWYIPTEAGGGNEGGSDDSDITSGCLVWDQKKDDPQVSIRKIQEKSMGDGVMRVLIRWRVW